MIDLKHYPSLSEKRIFSGDSLCGDTDMFLVRNIRLVSCPKCRRIYDDIKKKSKELGVDITVGVSISSGSGDMMP